MAGLPSNTANNYLAPHSPGQGSSTVAARGLQRARTNSFGGQPLPQYQAHSPPALPPHPLPALQPLPALPALPPLPALPTLPTLPPHLLALLPPHLLALLPPHQLPALPAPAQQGLAFPAPAIALPAHAFAPGPAFVGIGPHRPAPLHANQAAPQIIAPRASLSNTFLPFHYTYPHCSSLHARELFRKPKGLIPGQAVWLQLPLPHLNITIDEHLVVDGTATHNGKNCLEFRRIDANNSGLDVVVMFRGVGRLVEDILARYYVGVDLGGTKVGCTNFHVYAVRRPAGRYLGTLKELKVRCCHRNGLAI